MVGLQTCDSFPLGLYLPIVNCLSFIISFETLVSFLLETLIDEASLHSNTITYLPV
jgi:hypothetical protein